MRRRHRIALVIVAAVIGIGAHDARADDVSKEAKEAQSRALFIEGRSLIESGNCVDAMARLRESLALNESVGARLSLASCLRRDHRLETWHELKRAQFFATKMGDPRLAYAKEQAASLEPDLAMIDITLTESDLALSDLRVDLDGVRLERFDYVSGGIAVEAGRHTIEVSAQGKKKVVNETRAMVGARVVVAIALEDDRPIVSNDSSGAASSSSSQSNNGKSMRTVGLVVGGVGGASVVGVGAIFGLLASSTFTKAKDACSPYPHCSEGTDHTRATDLNGRATSFATVSTIGFIAGAVMIATGVVLFIIASPPPSKARTASPKVGGDAVLIHW